MRYLAPVDETRRPPDPLLYVHGMSFSSARSIANRFEGRSCRDELCDAGFEGMGAVLMLQTSLWAEGVGD